MTDDRLEQIVGNLLRAGVALAAAVVLAGGVWYLWTHGSARVDYHLFHAQASPVLSWSGFWSPEGIILGGLLLLIATPVARVAFCLIAFALQRDWVYVGMTSVVLGVLLLSIGTAWR
jgi:uncharacterized membrane protein